MAPLAAAKDLMEEEEEEDPFIFSNCEARLKPLGKLGDASILPAHSRKSGRRLLP